MKTPEQVYLERPPEWGPNDCKAAYENCLKIPEVTWHCVSEGRDVRLCGACVAVWRSRVAADPALRSRCPGCEGAWRAASSASAALQAPAEIMQGPAADAIRHALHMEGILQDKQDAVLRRLWAEAPCQSDATDPVRDAREYELRRRQANWAAARGR